MEATYAQGEKDVLKNLLERIELSAFIGQMDPRFDLLLGDWHTEFDPMVKERIYYLIKDKDCYDPQKEFDNSATQMTKKQNSGMSGTKHLELMKFIEDKLLDFNC